MRFNPSLGRSANRAVGDMASRVDDRTGEAAQRATRVIVLAVRVLRIPTAFVLWVAVPFIALTVVLAWGIDGPARIPLVAAGILMALVSAAFAGRRYKILAAVSDPDKLATELGIMVSLSDKVGETRGALEQIAGGDGWRVFSRLRGLWQGAGMTGRWISGISDLPRARYFGPPKIGTTVTLAIAALWLVPISILMAVFTAIARLAAG